MRRSLVFALLAALLAFLSPTASTQTANQAGDVRTATLTGTVTVADKGTYQEHPFDVPAGLTRIDVAFTYEGRGAGTELEVGLFDPERFRGTSRFSKSRVHLTEFETTPSYLAGPLPAGRWRLSLGIPSIPANASSTWTAAITMSSKRTPREGLAPVLKHEAGWYRGDLHAHTLHSDAFDCQAPGDLKPRGCQPWEVVEEARAKRLDFFAVTDHNTTSHHADLATIQESLPTMLLLRGQELTTFRGHANVYGTSRVIDFRLGFGGRSMVDVMHDVRREGALLSINHPGRETGDRCTGCGWDAPNTPWDRIEAMEVVNGTNVEGPTAGLPFWYARLNDGHRITAIGGSDDHGARSPRGRIATPTTMVFARELSEAALLDGIREGRVYVRTRGPAGPRLELTGIVDGRPTEMGGTVEVPADGTEVALTVRANDASGQAVEIVRNGEVAARLDVPSDEAELSHTLRLAPGQWVHVRLRDQQGITAFSNPVYARHRR